MPRESWRRWFLADTGQLRHPIQLLCLPHAGGGASSYRDWLGGLVGGADVIPVQLPGRENRIREPLPASMSALVNDLTEAVAQANFVHVALFGHSLGAIMATKLSEALEACSTPVRHLFVSGYPGPGQILARRTVRMAGADDAVLLESLADIDAALSAKLDNEELRAIALAAIRADLRLAATCRFGNERLASPITVLGGVSDPLLAGQNLSRWGALTRGDCMVFRLPGDHFYLATQGPALAGIISGRLAPDTRDAGADEAVTPFDPPEVTTPNVIYDPYDPQVHDDPYVTYGALRQHAPVYRNDDVDFWALSRHADVALALRDTRRFSSANGILIEPSAWGPSAHHFQSLLAMDPPGHTRIRALTAAPFGRHRMPLLEPMIRRAARDVLDPLLDAGTFDFARDFAGRFPADVLCQVMGVPNGDRAYVAGLAQAAARHNELSRDIPVASFAAAGQLSGVYRALVADRRRRRRDDLISELLDAELGGKRLTEDEIVAFLHALTGAANDTVVHLLGSAWFWAWRCPQQGNMALTGEIAAWIEETLRYDTPTQFVARTLVPDLDLHGVRVPAGARILLLIGAANRDPEVFPAADSYELSRDSRRTLSFGKGRHTCLGAAVARTQARIALEELVARVAEYDIRVAGIRRAPSAEIRGFTNLPTTVTRRR